MNDDNQMQETDTARRQFVAYLLAGGAAMGMLGLLIAMPLMATVVILIDEFVLPALREFADEDAPR